MKIELTKNISIDLIEKISQLVENEFSDLFLAVVVHGSVATNEIIPYSDFDGLLIVKDQHHGSRSFNKFISKSMKLIHQFDPLQHHGWFVIKASELSSYPQTYFPYELFEFSSLIYPQTIELEIELPEKIDYSLPFQNLCASLEKKIKQNFKPKNDYQLKSYLSEIMLLPTLFLQAKYAKGIHKKTSFELIKPFLSQNAVAILDNASQKRKNWIKLKPNFITFSLVSYESKISKKIAQKFLFSNKNNSLFKAEIDNFNKNLLILVSELKQQL